MIAPKKTLSNTDANGASKNVKDLTVWGNGDTFKLICKASSAAEGWMKSTKAMEVQYMGVVLQVTTQQGSNVAEALTFIPGASIAEVKDDNGEVISRSITAMTAESISERMMQVREEALRAAQAQEPGQSEATLPEKEDIPFPALKAPAATVPELSADVVEQVAETAAKMPAITGKMVYEDSEINNVIGLKWEELNTVAQLVWCQMGSSNVRALVKESAYSRTDGPGVVTYNLHSYFSSGVYATGEPLEKWEDVSRVEREEWAHLAEYLGKVTV
jgi:hypothetical protein